MFHEFELSRIQLSGWASYEEPAGVNITVDTVRSSSNRSYQGWMGMRSCRGSSGRLRKRRRGSTTVALRAGIVPDLLLQYAEASWGYRVQGPTGLERDALYTPGDLGASVEVALPWQLGAAAIQVGNGEGISLREQNNGKNLTGVLRL